MFVNHITVWICNMSNDFFLCYIFFYSAIHRIQPNMKKIFSFILNKSESVIDECDLERC